MSIILETNEIVNNQVPYFGFYTYFQLRCPAMGVEQPDARKDEALRRVWLLGIFAVTVSVVHLLLVNTKNDKGNAFIRMFMLATTLKFFLYLAVLVGFLLYSKDNRQTLALHFLFYYFVFSVLEVSVLYKEVRK